MTDAPKDNDPAMRAMAICAALDAAANKAVGGASPWLLWPFAEAPVALRALSTNGGDEDWILVVPLGEFRPAWAESGGQFGCCSVDEYVLPCGRRVLIGSHS